MNKVLSGILAFSLAVGSSSVALAGSVAEDQHLQLIAIFHDKKPLPRMQLDRRSHRAVQLAMMDNARVSQSSTAAALRRLQPSSQILFKQYWLINAMAISIPRGQLSTLTKDPNIKRLVPNQVFHLVRPVQGVRVPPMALRNGGYTYGLQKLNIPTLWEKAPEIRGTGVPVGILDTGIDASHPDLVGKTVLWKDFIKSSQTPYDDHGHGTHVAGTIAGGATSGTQIGVAPGAKLLIGKIFSAAGSTTMAVIMEAMQWMADPDSNPATNDFPVLVSNSWGGGVSSASTNPDDLVQCQLVNAWVKLGMLPVFANGNSGPRASSVILPAACPAALGVGATDDKDAIASFSSRGPAKWSTGNILKPLVSAPGVKVLSSTPGGKYDAWSGTSMATPHVAGMMALAYQLFPNMSVDQAMALAAEGTVDLGPTGPDNDFGAGRVDALKTLKKAHTRLRQ